MKCELKWMAHDFIITVQKNDIFLVLAGFLFSGFIGLLLAKINLYLPLGIALILYAHWYYEAYKICKTQKQAELG